MKKEDQISEEQLNAFVDGELDSEELSSLFDEAEQSVELDQRLCQQRKLKELVKLAYQDIPDPKRLLPRRPTPRGVVGLAMVASVLLVLGFITGMVAHNYLGQHPAPNAVAAVDSSTQAAALAENYILHVTSGDPEKMKLALQKARELLTTAEPGKPRRVEVVANERGLDLLRSDVTLFGDEISALSLENVVFYACSRAIEHLETQGVEVRLVPEANTDFTALDRVVGRMQDGWHYIKI